jgi:trehalose synthase
MGLSFPRVSVLPLERYAMLLDETRMRRALLRAAELRERLSGRVVWNVSSTAVGGGVAEMVRSLLAYARGAGVDARWVVIEGPPAFFSLTKRLHNAIHGSAGDGSPLGDDERRLFAAVAAQNAAELLPMVRPGDVAIVHDPQPAGLVPPLVARGAEVIWRCHIGHELVNAEVERGWRFLQPYVRDAAAYVFSRASYVPPLLDAARARVIPPSIDPFSPKNQPLDPAVVRAILARAGIVAGPGDAPTPFEREDGTPGRVDRAAEIVRDGPPPPLDAPLVVQVSRWDRLKDPVGVLDGFARVAVDDVQLVLAGPNVAGVVDDPEGGAVYHASVDAWRALPVALRRRCQLVSLPTLDVGENAAVVNALQRHATVIVQKSLYEGFGLTVAEAMWKSRPVVASAVGGIRDQVDDGVHGLLIADPHDGAGFAAALERILADPAMAARMGEAGHARVVERYLGLDSLLRFGAVIESLDLATASHEGAFGP